MQWMLRTVLHWAWICECILAKGNTDSEWRLKSTNCEIAEGKGGDLHGHLEKVRADILDQTHISLVRERS